jgi:TPR repeat protein
MLYLTSRLSAKAAAKEAATSSPSSSSDAAKKPESPNATTPATQSLPDSVDPTMQSLPGYLERASLLHKRACDLGNGQSCSASAQLALSGVGGPKDVQGAMERYELGCERDDANACFNLGALLLTGEKKHGVKPDLERAAKLEEKGCNLGHPNACQFMAVMYLKGDGVEKDMKKHEYYKKLTISIVQQTGEKLGAEVVGL